MSSPTMIALAGMRALGQEARNYFLREKITATFLLRILDDSKGTRGARECNAADETMQRLRRPVGSPLTEMRYG